MKTKRKLGEILIEAGLLTRKRLQNALTQKKQSNLKLGQYLVQEGIATESEIADALSMQLKIAKYQPQHFEIDKEISQLIPVKMAYRFQTAPLKKKNNLLTVAMVDPLYIDAVDAFEHISEAEVEILICTEQQLNQLLTMIYGAFPGIDGFLEDIDDVKIDQDNGRGTGIEDLEMSSLQDMAEEAPVVALVNSIISQAIRDCASDVHISPTKDLIRVRFRVDGRLHQLPAPPKSMFLPIVSRLKLLAGMDIAVSRVPQDGRFTVRMANRDINVRASVIPSIYGENLVLRLLNSDTGVYSLEELGISENDRQKIQTAITRHHGMILSTGPTGSGKSTSLYAILKKLNLPEINIVTVEDPVEYRIDDILQIQLNTKAGMTFAGGLRSILRQDPDVIMVGEIRDYETASMAVQAALTGHRVLSTLHTTDAAGAFTRLIDMGIEPFLVSSVMVASIAQRLVRKVCPNCKVPARPSDDVLKYWQLATTDATDFVKGKGCIDCMYTGYKGRTGIYEILIVDEEIQNLILKSAPGHEITKAAIASGQFIPLRTNAVEKVIRGITTFKEAASSVLV